MIARRAKMAATCCPDPVAAVRDLFERLDLPKSGLTLFFCSPNYDLVALGAALARQFPGVDLIGCTSCGEIAPSGYVDGCITAVSFPSDDYVVVSGYIEQLGPSVMSSVHRAVQTLRHNLERRAPDATAANTFALLLIDGLSGVEETVISVISAELGDIPLVGGSASDNLRYRQTAIYHAGKFRTSGAVLALVHTALPFEVFSTQHFVSSGAKMVVTEADPLRRAVMELNAEPAAEEYARLVGVQREALTARVFATHPVMVRVGGNYYVRSIQRVDDDQSLKFYCAIDEGIVLTLASGRDIAEGLSRLFADIRRNIGEPAVIIGFDCVFRKLEIRQRRLTKRISRLLAENNVIGFSTYGEQFHAMHLNQTFTGVAIGRGG
jgi:hypothetical protein